MDLYLHIPESITHPHPCHPGAGCDQSDGPPTLSPLSASLTRMGFKLTVNMVGVKLRPVSEVENGLAGIGLKSYW
jgi:hypothetical protein